MKKTIILFLSQALPFFIFSQVPATPDPKRAMTMAREAVKLMDNGDPDKAIVLLDSAKKFDSGNYLFDYEIGFAYNIKKDYKKAIEYFQKALSYPNANDQCYQMLGNTYDEDGNKEKALAAYTDGLKKFPLSGPLHMETGIIYHNEKNYTEAVKWWEKGVKVAPTYPSNYFQLASLFAYTEHRIWTFFYGEIFMNLEPSSKRSQQMSELLFETYKKSITVLSDTSARVDFTNSEISLDPGKEFKIPFRMVFGLDFLMGISVGIIGNKSPDKQISIAYLDQARKAFIDHWFNQKRDKEYPNIVIDFHKELKDNNHFEAYNYWLLRNGDGEEFEKWYKANTPKFEAFAAFMNKKEDIVSKEKYFIRPTD